jgi:hypothetical protein
MRPRITTGTRRRSSSRKTCGRTSIKGPFALRSLTEQNRFASPADALCRRSASVAGSSTQDGRIRTARRPRCRETMLRDRPAPRGSPTNDSTVAHQVASIGKFTTPGSCEVIAQGPSTTLIGTATIRHPSGKQIRVAALDPVTARRGRSDVNCPRCLKSSFSRRRRSRHRHSS